MNIPYRAKNSKCLLLITFNFVFLLVVWTNACHKNYEKSESSVYNSNDISRVSTFEFSDAAEATNRKSGEPYFKVIKGYLPNSKTNPHVEDTPIINNYQFEYPINVENVCKDSKVEVLIPIHSAVTNFDRRQKIRKSNQGFYASDKRNRAHLLFFVGQPRSGANSQGIQQELRKEWEAFGDIIQINVEDVYHNISLKALAVLNWVSRNCNNSEFILKTDDDIVVNTPQAVSALHWAKESQPHFVMGYVRRFRKPVYRYGKYRVDKEDYAFPTFPPYVAGAVMGYPTATALLLYQQALRVKRLWLDDAFISGICANKLGIPVIGATQLQYSHTYTRLL